MKKTIEVSNGGVTLDTNRRNFLKLSDAGLMLAGCRDDDFDYPQNDVFDLGKGDVDVLNYAYALEQLEADFYTKVVNNFYKNISDAEKQMFTDIYHHEVVHRDFFKAAISGATNDVLPKLEFKYDGVDLNSRNSILATAKALEDTGVAAYNGAGKLISNLDYLVMAGKIVSVEARRAFAIRNAINPGSQISPAMMWWMQTAWMWQKIRSRLFRSRQGSSKHLSPGVSRALPNPAFFI